MVNLRTLGTGILGLVGVDAAGSIPSLSDNLQVILQLLIALITVSIQLVIAIRKLNDKKVEKKLAEAKKELFNNLEKKEGKKCR
jgi:hypothetical protein